MQHTQVWYRKSAGYYLEIFRQPLAVREFVQEVNTKPHETNAGS